MLGAPELDTALLMGFHKSKLEEENHLPQPPGHASYAAQLASLYNTERYSLCLFPQMNSTFSDSILLSRRKMLEEE